MKHQNTLSIYNADNIHPYFSIDCVILSYYKNDIKVLLIRPDYLEELPEYWVLPGGFMYRTENAEQAAQRILKQRTGLSDTYLRQFHLFSNVDRTIIEQNKKIAVNNPDKWFLERFISLGFYSFVKYDCINLMDKMSEENRWHSINNLPLLYSDHKNIIETAIKKIRNQIWVLPIGYELLPRRFAMTELRRIYEIVLGKPLDRRNFQRKIVSSGIVRQCEQDDNKKASNARLLYSFITEEE